jgi:cell division protein FtsW
MTTRFWILVLSVLVLFILGLAQVFNTTAAEVLDRSLKASVHHALVKQLLYAILAAVLAVGVWFLGFDQFLRLSGPFLVAGSALLVLVFVPGIGQQINGAHRWLGVGSYSFQPSEFVKYLIPIYFIHKVTSLKIAMGLKEFLFLLLKLAIPMGLILMEPDNGSVAIILSSLLVLFFLTKIRLIYWAVPLAVLTLLGGAIALQMPHVQNRLSAYLHPESDLQGKGHQPHQAKIAAGSGGLFGRGLGESLQKLNYLPHARSDYIAAIFAEEFGFLGMLLLILLYMGIGFLGFSIAANAKSLPAFYLAAILTFLICFQAFLNLGVASGLLPSKGVNLPFFSQGGTSLLANFMAICLILNIESRQYEAA